MTRREYTAQVLENLRRVTRKEREAIEAEIDAHMEDHICDLLDLGYSPELAEERTMSFMGDPAEVGRELDKQYSGFWLTVGQICKALAILLAVNLLFQVTLGNGAFEIQSRLDPTRSYYKTYLGEQEYIAARALDIKVEIGNDILYIYQVGIRPDQQGGLEAGILACNYDRDWWGIPSVALTRYLRYTTSVWDGAEVDRQRESPLAKGIPITREDTYVLVRYDRFGYTAEVQVPLCWEEYDEACETP